MKRLMLLLSIALVGPKLKAQTPAVSSAEMTKIYEEVKTPYKYGLVLVPQRKGELMDCPTIYTEGKYWYMT